MSKFFLLDLHAIPEKQALFEKLVSTYSSFSWRRGDSDQQGPYISGMDPDSVQIKIWLGEFPAAVSISFSNNPNPVLSPDEEDIFVDDMKSFFSSYGEVVELQRHRAASTL